LADEHAIARGRGAVARGCFGLARRKQRTREAHEASAQFIVVRVSPSAEHRVPDVSRFRRGWGRSRSSHAPRRTQNSSRFAPAKRRSFIHQGTRLTRATGSVLIDRRPAPHSRRGASPRSHDPSIPPHPGCARGRPHPGCARGRPHPGCALGRPHPGCAHESRLAFSGAMGRDDSSLSRFLTSNTTLRHRRHGAWQSTAPSLDLCRKFAPRQKAAAAGERAREQEW
jgi:hypothetical protein